MIPVHVALLAPALRPSLVAVDSALQSAPCHTSNGFSDVAASLHELNVADTSLANALRELGPLIERSTCPDEVIYNAADTIRAQLRRLLAAYRDTCTLSVRWVEYGEIAPETTLAKAARDVLVTYAHFLAELIRATAQPLSIIGNGATALGNNRWELSLHCKTNLPERADELNHWIPAGIAYDQAAVNRALRLSANPVVVELPLEPREDPSPAPAKALSFWEILGIAGLLSLLTGCDCND